MKKLALYPILILFLLVSCKNEKELKNEAKPMTIGNLTLSTEHPKPGETIDVTYNNPGETEAFYVYMVGQNNYPLDIDLSRANEEQKSSINIPDSAVALAFIFKTDDTYDDNDKKGYLIPLYSDENTQIAGSNSALAYYVDSYGDNYGIKTDADAMLTAMTSDFEAHPELKSDWQEAYLDVVYKKDKDQGKTLIDDYLDSLSEKKDKTEKEYTSMIRYYAITEQTDKSDSIKTIALEQFPKGTTANMAMLNKFQAEGDLKKKEDILKTYSEANPKLGNIGNYMASNIARAYFEKNDMANFETYVSMVDDNSSRASTLNNLAWDMAEKGNNLNEAEKISKTSLDLITALQENPTDKPDYVTQKQYKKNLDSNYSMYADTYALIMFKQGNIKEAITYQEKAHDPKARDTDANERYILYLMADNQYDAVTKKAQEFIELGYSNETIKEAYKTAYAKTNPDSTNLDERLATMEATAVKNAMADIKKSMIDEEAPKFALKDMEGKEVSLESLKGKIVILDFWATWCGPCKASFPGMQEVVTKYKDDPSVALLFVDTFERGDDREQKVEDFIKKNNYTFHVVYDSDDSTIAEQYGVKGIPTKVIIGPNGNMRFKSVGYNGSNDKLVKEMDMMISALKS